MASRPTILTRSDLGQHLAQAGYCGSQAKARAAVDVIVDAIAAALRQGDGVALRHFGRFEVVATPARPGRNPKTGEPFAIPAGRRVRFAPSKYLLTEEAP